ncbi:MAG: hypothetical protein ACKV2Q_17555, partial [Planctomycetaceae bacterium]
MFSTTIGPTRTEVDFVNHIQTLVATEPDVPWRIVLDRLNVRRGDFKSVADLADKLAHLLKYFNETMAHPFDWTYTGKPVFRSSVVPFYPPHRRPNRLSKVELAKLAL